MNAIVLGDEGRSQKATATQKVCLIGIFTCSHITFPMIYSFYFLCVGFTWNEQNRLWGMRGRGQESTACSEGISSRKENDILRQYNDEFIMYSNSLRYHFYYQ